MPVASGPVTGHHWKEPGSVLFASSLQVFIHIDEIPPEPSLFQTDQSHLSQPFVTWGVFHSLHQFCRLSLEFLSSMSMPPLYLGGQKWIQLSRYGLTSAEQRGRITSLNTMATLQLMQPRIPLTSFATGAHFWLTFNLVSTRTPESFSAKLLYIWMVSNICCFSGMSSLVHAFLLVTGSLGFRRSIFLEKTEMTKAISTSAFSVSYITRALPLLSSRPTFSLSFFCYLQTYRSPSCCPWRSLPDSTVPYSVQLSWILCKTSLRARKCFNVIPPVSLDISCWYRWLSSSVFVQHHCVVINAKIKRIK